MQLNKAIMNAENNISQNTQTSFFSNDLLLRKKSITHTGNDHFDGVFGENLKDRERFGKKLRQRAGTIKLDFNTAKALMKEFVPVTKMEGETGFRLTNKAAHFDYDIRPYEDKGIRAKKERDIETKQMFGVTGAPERCYDRYINKLFDQRRQKSKECGNFNGCDVDYSHENLER